MNQILYVEKKIAEHKIVLIVLLFCVLFLSLIFSLINMGNEKIIPKVSIANIDLTNLSKEEARIKLQEDYSMPSTDTTIDIVINGQKYTTPITNVGLVPDYEAMAQNAYNIGREGNIFSNNYKILGAYIFGYNLEPIYVINDDVFDKLLATLKQDISETKIDDTYVIDDEYITITKGIDGISLDSEKLKKDIIYNYIKQNTNAVTATVQSSKAQKIDLDALHKQIHKEPVNAQSTVENGTIVYKEEIQGITFKLDEAKFLYDNTAEKTIKIPLIVTKPSITIDQLIQNEFGETLATFSTKYKESEKNRTVNVKLAASNINGTILMPGQEFSFNNIVGERTTKNGFKVATVYSANQLVQGLGGGICQVSSTLYNVALLADLNIVERRNHQLSVAYVPLGQDATVAYGSIDFRFTNNRSKPVKITAEAKNGVLTINLLGTKDKSDEGKEIVIKTVTNSSKAFTTKTIEDNTMNVGEKVIIQNGGYGFTVSTYKIVKVNGTEISNTFLHKDTYNPLQEIVKVGTKTVEPVTPIEPTQPIEPSTPDVPTEPDDPTPPIDTDPEPEPLLPPGWDVPENPLAN